MTTKTVALPVQGMTCASCVGHVERALRQVVGVSGAQVNLASERATVELNLDLGLGSVVGAVRDAGYDVPTEKATLPVGGMTCASCVARVERALKKVPGVQEATVNLATESARITFAAGEQMEARLRRAVRDAGYEPRTPAQMDAADDASPWAGFAPVAIGLVLSAPLVLPMLGDLFGQHWMLPAWVQFMLATPVQFILGARFYKAGWHALLALTGNMDLLVAIGTTAGWALSMWLWLSAAPGTMPHLYFEGSAVVVTLVLLGKFLEARAKRQTTTAIRALHALRPDVAHLIGLDGEMEVPVAEVMVGDRIVVPFTITCGHCFFCKKGLYSCCDNTNRNAETAAAMMGIKYSTRSLPPCGDRRQNLPF